MTSQGIGESMGRTVLINAGPWLPVPPVDYGGIEHVIACLVPELRRRGHRVVLATVGESTIEADEKLWVHPQGQFRQLAAPYGQVMGVVHAHMQQVLERINRPQAGPAIDLIHDHLEVVGPSMLALLGSKLPPVLHTLHWDLGKHPEFYSSFDGGGRVLFNGVSQQQLEGAPPRLRAQTLGTIPLAVDLGEYAFHADKQPYFVTLGRFARVKGQDIAARLCKELGLELRMAGPVAATPTPEKLFAELARPQSRLPTYADVRYYLDEVRTYEDGERIRWVGSVCGRAKQELVGRASALLAPVRWTEPGATAAVEALACGTPVIAMRRGAFAAIVEHGVTGFLADDERELADYLGRAGEIDPAACRDAVEERFSAATMASAYTSFYEQVIARAGGQAAPPRRPPG